MRAFILLFAGLIAFGCNSSTGPAVVMPGESFTLSPGSSARISGSEEVLLFKSVPEDGRCPIELLCFWAGNARVSLSLSGTDFDLNTFLKPRDTVLRGYSISLQALEPPQSNQHPPQERDYRATFIVTKN